MIAFETPHILPNLPGINRSILFQAERRDDVASNRKHEDIVVNRRREDVEERVRKEDMPNHNRDRVTDKDKHSRDA